MQNTGAYPCSSQGLSTEGGLKITCKPSWVWLSVRTDSVKGTGSNINQASKRCSTLKKILCSLVQPVLIWDIAGEWNFERGRI